MRENGLKQVYKLKCLEWAARYLRKSSGRTPSGPSLAWPLPTQQQVEAISLQTERGKW